MIELYSVKETAKIFGLSPSQLRYWTQTGFAAPTVRRGGRLFYTFRDLVGVKAAADLLATGITMDQARPSIDALRERLPQSLDPRSPLTVCSDGRKVEVTRDDEVTPPSTREVVVAFRLSSLAAQIADVLKRPVAADLFPEDDEPLAEGSGSLPVQAIPSPITGSFATEKHAQPSAYECFRTGYDAEKSGDRASAEAWYLRALALEPSLAAAHTNLGNVLYAQGERERARIAYETALDHDPEQAEARYNLGNLLDEIGETELAIAELRQVVSRHPAFADAHYNLGLVLYRLGGISQARAHLARYLELDDDSDWAARAKAFLSATE